MDRFKEVNDTLGHEAGDALLQRVSNQLRTILRSADFVARLGGDEFAFLFSGGADQARQKAVRVAERILEKLHMKVSTPNGGIQVGCTVGVAMYPAEAADAETLMALADRLMYIGKKSGRNRLVTADALEPPEADRLLPRRTA
ncbi:GGDEF domain-containing protein [Mesorhizobium sp. M0435]|uniref:GGDEF domain-containing protein n=1 Tax=unclassified Mesorhizobium TaxID=325217 RepID=UPI00333E177E